MGSMHITDPESSFQIPASRKRKTSSSPSLPPANQPSKPPNSYQNRTLLIATGIDLKCNTQIRIMSELRQYHPNLRIFRIKHTQNGWIFVGDAPKDFAILQSEPEMQKVFGKTLRCHFRSHVTLQTPLKIHFGL